MRPRRHGLVASIGSLAAAGALLAAVAACDQDVPKEGGVASASERDGGAASDAEQEQARRRQQAFGLPLPPRVLEIERGEERVFVKTDMRLKELEAFYRERLLDYELLLIGSSLRAIPLREEMPWVTVSRPFGPHYPLHVTYTLPDPSSLSIPTHAADGTPLSEEERQRERQRRAKPVAAEKIPKQGAPVQMRTPSGELLAPGARWGEPYTPPPGSPLDTKRNRPNFGRPFGDWRAD